MSSIDSQRRVLSGMRPTGRLHLGHLYGVIHNWVQLQHDYECFLFVADWHALTTHYEHPEIIEDNIWDMVIDWLAAGVSPSAATLFLQSRVPEHAELHLLLSMITPLGWLERVPTYKDMQENLKDKDLATYGFLGYPLLQSADILIYRAGFVPVGADQVAHVELTREVARRFNHLYGRSPDFEDAAKAAIAKMGKKVAALYDELRRKYQEQGDAAALERARALLREQQNLTLGDRDRLFGYLEGSGKIILIEPQAKLTPAAKMSGLDGRKMSKSYDNVISLRDDTDTITKKIRTMPTDPARVRRSDPGSPARCPVWQLHEIFSTDTTREWVQQGCQSAGIGCLDCKKPLIDSIDAELSPIRDRARQYEQDLGQVKAIINTGSEKARDVARDTLHDVRQALGLNYR
ncbi:MAG: tryptophan--tRNA ligase [Pseudomonadales bacterium]|nr:tryptophan--tRNA ligase [Pseudomonadales bacterium]